MAMSRTLQRLRSRSRSEVTLTARAHNLMILDQSDTLQHWSVIRVSKESIVMTRLLTWSVIRVSKDSESTLQVYLYLKYMVCAQMSHDHHMTYLLVQMGIYQSLPSTKNLVDGFDVDPDLAVTDCDTCHQAKLTQNAQPKISTPHNTIPGDIIHTDVWGPAPVHTINGAQYFITFIDDASRYTAIAFMASKDETTLKIQYYLAYIKRQYSYKPKAIHADNSREYVNKTLKEWCLKHGIEMQTTALYSPAQNGIAERTNQTIMELM